MTEKKVRMFPKLYKNEFGEGWVLQIEQTGGDGSESLDYEFKFEEKNEMSPFTRFDVTIVKRPGR